jgi:1-acyl-sn-glycerol-3-phosphate acyltransferase
MQRSLWKRLGYGACHVMARLWGTALFRVRVEGRENMPATGGALVCANHQSYFDPVLIGLSLDRRLNYLARDTLFRNPLFKWLIEFLDAIPIDREGGGLAGLKETLRRLKQDELVLIFPEGTRTRDGELQPLKPGFCAVARRGRQPILPVAFDGAYQAWPRTSPVPQLSPIAVVIGEPISPEQIAAFTDEQLVDELAQRMAACFLEARRMRLGKSTPETASTATVLGVSTDKSVPHQALPKQERSYDEASNPHLSKLVS